MTRTTTERALALLTAASPETPVDILAGLSIGRRDSLLLILRAWMFGSQLVGLVNCPCCADPLELDFDTEDMLSKHSANESQEFAFGIEDLQVRFRLPTSSDLLVLRDSTDAATFRDRLFSRCLLSVQRDGQQTTATTISASLANTILDKMVGADPEGDIQMSLCCPSCKHEWRAIFDVVSFFWAEVNAWAIRMLREVHLLASAYGWSERDVLTMSASRREIYLELVGS